MIVCGMLSSGLWMDTWGGGINADSSCGTFSLDTTHASSYSYDGRHGWGVWYWK
jgi:hypothetical protein